MENNTIYCNVARKATFYEQLIHHTRVYGMGNWLRKIILEGPKVMLKWICWKWERRGGGHGLDRAGSE